jgi:hypothetical protein
MYQSPINIRDMREYRIKTWAAHLKQMEPCRAIKLASDAMASCIRSGDLRSAGQLLDIQQSILDAVAEFRSGVSDYKES